MAATEARLFTRGMHHCCLSGQGLRAIFFSRSLTASWDSDATTPNSTTLPGQQPQGPVVMALGNTSLARQRQSGGSFAGSIRPACDTGWLGDGRAAHRQKNLLRKYRRLVRNTVRGDVSRATATCEALRPSSES